MGKRSTGINDSSKIYLESDYKAHLGMSDRCADHCVTHALSDSRNVEYCQQCQNGDEHDLIYERCQEIRTILEKVESKIMFSDTSLTENQRAQQHSC